MAQPANWHHGMMACLDLETTDADPETARIVTATIAVVDGSRKVSSDITSWLADPGMEIPAEAAAIHGITTEHAREHGRPARDVAVEIHSMLQTCWSDDMPVVGFNINYDLTVLDREMARHNWGELFVGGPVIDPLVLDRSIDRYRRGSRKLVDMCQHYGVKLDGAHDATQDALAAGRLAYMMATRNPQLAATPLSQLHEAQVGWYAAWAADFTAYRAKRGQDPVDGSWPVRKVPVTP